MTKKTIRLETRGLSAGYNTTPIVAPVEFTLRDGEILVLLGPNGAGKSTLLKTVAGQLAPLGGTVYLCGEDMKTTSASDIAKRLSLLGTERQGAELMTCREVAASGRYPYTGRLGILSREDWRIVDRCIARMGAQALSSKPFDAVSDGQKQRILLARALCQEPEVLILDEPASYLDIRYQLELVKTLCSLAEDGLSILISLHELDLARRCGGRALCLKDGAVDRIGPMDEIFAGDYLERLFGLPAGSLGTTREKQFDHYIRTGGKRMRCGYTTGTCAALAAAGAARRLLFGHWPETAALTTPKGIRVEVPLEERADGDDFARCGVRKDAGDDADCTADALICARVALCTEPGIHIDGGAGVGRVTKPGLDQPAGAAAINTTPRRMIAEAVEAVCAAAEYTGGIQVTLSVPGGETMAKKTFNPDLGIEGGISILGTSGIVEPMSSQALIDTICLTLRQEYAQGRRRVILTPGNYGADYLRREGLDRLGVPVVKCSNFIGDALDEICALGFDQVLLAGHIGKLVKLAGGIMNTHSRQADCRRELFAAHAAVCGGSPELCRALMDCVSTDACLDILEEHALMGPVMEHLLPEIGKHLQKRAGQTQAGAVVFSNVHGTLGETSEAKTMIAQWRRDAAAG